MICIVEGVFRLSYQCTYIFAAHHVGQVTDPVHIEYNNGQVVFLAQSESGHIHHLKLFTDHFVEADGLVTGSTGVLFRIGRVNTIDTGTFKNYVCIDLDSTERACSICSKIRIARTGAKDYDTAFFKVAYGPA